jgi:hypothetical protein
MLQLDLAKSIPDSLVEITHQPSILRVSNGTKISRISKGTKIFTGVIIGICGSISLAMFCFIVIYRNHRVMTLAQAGLLGWLSACSVITIGSSFLILPTRDIFCRLNNLVIVPATMMAAILVGRLWRVYTTLSVANNMGRNSPTNIGKGKSRQSFLELSEARVMNVLGMLAFSRLLKKKASRGGRRQSASLRQATTRADTVRLILILSLPQAVLQIVHVAYYNSTSGIEITEDGRDGKEKCSDDGFRWFIYTGYLILALMYILAVYVAWCARYLPTAFNEKDQIFRAATINGVVSLLVIVLLVVTDSPTSNANVSVRYFPFCYFVFADRHLTLTSSCSLYCSVFSIFRARNQ